MTLSPKHKNPEQAGILPSMDMPHHLQSHEWCRYREGSIVGPAPTPKQITTNTSSEEKYAYVECGLPYPVRVPILAEAPVEEGMRTTIRLAEHREPGRWPQLTQWQCEALEATAYPSSLPQQPAPRIRQLLLGLHRPPRCPSPLHLL